MHVSYDVTYKLRKSCALRLESFVAKDLCSDQIRVYMNAYKWKIQYANLSLCVYVYKHIDGNSIRIWLSRCTVSNDNKIQRVHIPNEAIRYSHVCNVRYVCKYICIYQPKYIENFIFFFVFFFDIYFVYFQFAVLL